MPRLRAKHRKTADKEKSEEKEKLPSTGDYWDARPKYVYDTHVSRKTTKAKRVFICKICGRKIDALGRPHSHRRKKIKR